MDFKQFCNDNNIETASHSDRHHQDNWTHIACPFCMGNAGHHLGYNIEDDFFCCWRCGFKNHYEVVRMLLDCSFSVAKDLLGNYGSTKIKSFRKEKTKQILKNIELPKSAGALTKRHIKYLEKRNFDAEKLQLLWGLKGTGITGPDKFRIIAPIYYRNKLVSYQGRDVTNKQGLKYKTCEKEKESIFHKHIVFGYDCIPEDSVVICEGIFDVFRLGYGAVATFGIKFLPEQINLLSEFKNHFILYDSDPQAQKQAKKMANQLSAFSNNIEIIQLESGDPADMKQKEADELMRELLN